MNLTYISFKNLLSKPLSSVLSLLLLVLGVAMISFMMEVNQNLENDFRKNIKDIDMVIGAKGSPLQLILSAVYQIDNPTGNINYEEAKRTVRNPLIKKAIPLAYGDSYNGFRIVGTEHSYPTHYDVKVATGKLWQEKLECTVGHRVAADLGLKVGDEFFSQHGLVDDTHVHDNMAFKVVGIFEESGTVLDRLMLTAIESVWAVHEPHEDGHDHSACTDPSHNHDAEAPKEITAMLIEFRSAMGNVMLPNMINKNTSFQSALPAIEINRLFELFGAGIMTLRIIAIAIIIISALSMFVSLFNSLKERKYELALMRSLGSSRARLFFMILIEANLLAVVGIILGFVVSRVGLLLAATFAGQQFGVSFDNLWPLSQEYYLFLLVLGVANVAAVIPALQVIRMNISDVLLNR